MMEFQEYMKIKRRMVNYNLEESYCDMRCSDCALGQMKNGLGCLCYDGGHKPGHSLNYCPNCGAKMIEEVLNA